MRRGLASLIIGLSLLVATLSWAGFTMSRTVLDPGRSERLAYQLLDNPEVRAALVTRLADQLEAQIPPEAPVPRSVVETGAALALDDPRVRTLMIDGIVRVHQNALNGNPEPIVLDAGALGSAGRDALVATRPELDPFLPATPSVALELPTGGLAWLGTVKRYVDRFTLLGAIVATIGAVTAFAVARDRASVLRRVAFWGYGAAAFWLLVGFAVPSLAGLLSPTSGAIAAAAIDVFFGAMIRPAVVLAVIASVLLAAGLTLPMLVRQRAARVLQPTRPGPAGAKVATGATAGGVVGTGRPMPRMAGEALVTRPPHLATAVQPTYRTVPPRVAPARTAPLDHTDEMVRPTANPNGSDPVASPYRSDPVARPTPSTGQAPGRMPVWEEGVGYIDDDPTDRRRNPFDF